MDLRSRMSLWFGIEEIATSKVLQALAAALLLTFLITFSSWTSAGYTFEGTTKACLPHLGTVCEAYKKLIPLTPLPYGYSENMFYTFLFGVICFGFYSLYTKQYARVWEAIFVLWLYKLYIIFGFGSGNYDYYDLVITAVFLFARNKLYWARIFFIILYFLSSTIKIHEGWILGTYFTSLQTGLPIIGNYLAPLATNIVIVSQMILSWLLLSKKSSKSFNIAFIFFLFFHLYSGILVEYRYMITSVPMLIILFWLPEKVEYRKTRNIFPYLFFILLLSLQSIAILIPGDQKLTLEGNMYGLYMFEANHQCIASYTIHYTSGKTSQIEKYNSDARNRCDPYTYVSAYVKQCQSSEVANISLTFDHSINGGPFYRIVDESNICQLHYVAFQHNSWIKTEQDSPLIEGYPVKNVYLVNVSRSGTAIHKDGYIILPGLEGNNMPELNPIQVFLSHHLHLIKTLYWTLWITELIYIIGGVFFRNFFLSQWRKLSQKAQVLIGDLLRSP